MKVALDQEETDTEKLDETRAETEDEAR